MTSIIEMEKFCSNYYRLLGIWLSYRWMAWHEKWVSDPGEAGNPAALFCVVRVDRVAPLGENPCATGLPWGVDPLPGGAAMEALVLGGLALIGLFVVGTLLLIGGGLLWLITLPFRLVGWVLGAVFFGLKVLFLLPLLVLFVAALVLAAPFVLLVLAFA